MATTKKKTAAARALTSGKSQGKGPQGLVPSPPKIEPGKADAGEPIEVEKPAPKKAPEPKVTTKPDEEIDATKLDPEEAKKRCAAIYKLEKAVERKRQAYDQAKRGAKSAKGSLEEAEEALEKEIREQRKGPGPLFDATGKGPAKKA